MGKKTNLVRMEKEKKKTINISVETWKALLQLKADFKKRSIDEVIQMLILGIK